MTGSFGEFVAAATTLVQRGRRTLLGITGTPGAGKSTLCAVLADALGQDAVLVDMDGFHLANAELIPLGRRKRKGAPGTFDVDGYVALPRRLRTQTTSVIYAPPYDRGIEESIGSATRTPRSSKASATVLIARFDSLSRTGSQITTNPEPMDFASPPLQQRKAVMDQGSFPAPLTRHRRYRRVAAELRGEPTGQVRE